jgi:hypothetical protein
MPEVDIISFIAAELKAGTPSDRIRKKLIEAGWPEGEIDSIWQGIRQVDTSQPPKPPRWYKKHKKEKKPRRVHWRLWLFLLLLGGIGYAGYYWHFINEPAKLVSQMIERVSQVQSLGYKADIRLEMQPELVLGLMVDKDSLEPTVESTEIAGWPVRLAISGSGALDWHESDQVASTLNASFRSISPLASDPVSIEYRSLADESYFRLKPTADLETTDSETTAPAHAALAGKWVRYSFPTAQRRFGDSWLMDLANRKDFALIFGKLLSELPGSGIMTSLDRLGLSEVDGELVWRLQPVLDNDRFRVKLAEAIGSSSADASYLSTLEVSEVELWIGREDRLPKRLAFNFAGGEGAARAQATVTLLFSDFDQRLSVELPDSYISFTEALTNWQ